MTVEEIARRIENPNLCTLQDVQVLEVLIQKYPYAQTLPILLLQTLGRTKSFDFEEKLKEHAFRISDRTHLYYLINQNDVEAPKAKETPIPVAVESTETVIESTQEIEHPENDAMEETLSISYPEIEEVEEPLESVSETVEVQPIEETAPIESNPGLRQEMELTTDNSKFATFEVKEMSFEPVEIDYDDQEIKALDFDEVPIFEEVDTVDKLETKVEEPQIAEEELAEIIEDTSETVFSEELVDLSTSTESPDEAPISTVIAEPDEVTELIAEPEIEETEVEEDYSAQEEFTEIPSVEISEKEQIVKPIALFDPTIDIDKIGLPEEKNKIEASAFQKEVSLDLITPSDDSDKNELTSHALSQRYPLTEEELGVPVDIKQGFDKALSEGQRSFVDWLKVSANTNSEEYQVKQRTNEIVEKFIKEEPKLTRISKTEDSQKKAAEFFKVSKIAKASLSKIDMPVSETLAEIFEAQGNFSRAIEAYQQLMLLIPEKKSFFADQIKKLKNK